MEVAKINYSLRQKCPYLEFFWFVFSRVRTEYGGFFLTDCYSENFFNNCFKMFLDNKHSIKVKVMLVPKKPFFYVFPYFLLSTIIIAN